jgi:hypothetical protein
VGIGTAGLGRVPDVMTVDVCAGPVAVGGVEMLVFDPPPQAATASATTLAARARAGLTCLQSITQAATPQHSQRADDS